MSISERDAAPNLADPAIKLKEFRARHKLTYPLLSDEDQTVYNQFGGGSIPSCVLIDRQGRYVTRIDGNAEGGMEEVKAQIEKLLNDTRPN